MHPTREAILNRLHDEYETLKALIDSLAVEQMVKPNVVGTWSIKDVIAHLVYWNMLPVREIKAALNGEDPATVIAVEDDDTLHEEAVNKTNAEVVDASLNQSVGDALADFVHSYQLVVKTVMELPDHAFIAGGDFERLLGDSIGDGCQ